MGSANDAHLGLIIPVLEYIQNQLPENIANFALGREEKGREGFDILVSGYVGLIIPTLDIQNHLPENIANFCVGCFISRGTYPL